MLWDDVEGLRGRLKREGIYVCVCVIYIYIYIYIADSHCCTAETNKTL